MAERLEIMWGNKLLDEGFTSIPNLVVRNWAKVGVQPAEWAFITALLTYKHDTRDPFPSQEQLAEDLGRHPNQVKRWIKSLKDKKLLRVGRRRNTNSKTWGNNVYSIKPLLDAIMELKGQPSLPEIIDYEVIWDDEETKEKIEWHEQTEKEFAEYVYIIQETQGQKYKIGKTKNIQSRIDGYKTSLPLGMKIEFVLKTHDMTALELHLHDVFNHSRINGEWFDIAKEEIEEAIKTMPQTHGVSMVNFELQTHRVSMGNEQSVSMGSLQNVSLKKKRDKKENKKDDDDRESIISLSFQKIAKEKELPEERYQEVLQRILQNKDGIVNVADYITSAVENELVKIKTKPRNTPGRTEQRQHSPKQVEAIPELIIQQLERQKAIEKPRDERTLEEKRQNVARMLAELENK